MPLSRLDLKVHLCTSAGVSRWITGQQMTTASLFAAALLQGEQETPAVLCLDFGFLLPLQALPPVHSWRQEHRIQANVIPFQNNSNTCHWINLAKMRQMMIQIRAASPCCSGHSSFSQRNGNLWKVPCWTAMDLVQREIKPQHRNTLMGLFH